MEKEKTSRALDIDSLKKDREEKIARYRQAVEQVRLHEQQAANLREQAIRLDAQIALLNQQIDGKPTSVSPVPINRAARRRAKKEAK